MTEPLRAEQTRPPIPLPRNTVLSTPQLSIDEALILPINPPKLSVALTFCTK